MGLGNNKLFEYLNGSGSVLIAGAGGGCDVYCALPFYFALRARGATVHLANLTFANLMHSERLDRSLYKVTADDDHLAYAPEHFLAAWLRHREIETPIYAFGRTGVEPIAQAYRRLVEMLEIDAILLVDGGTDALMRGDEFHLATPHEDIASLIAAAGTGVERQALVCTAFGVDAYHGICHAHFLENTAHFMKNGGYLGVFSMDPTDDETRAYLEAVEFLNQMQASHPSIVNASLATAIEGYYGDHHRTHRTAGTKLWINPLMSLCWAFEVDAVVKRLLYANKIKNTKSYDQLCSKISLYRGELTQSGGKREFEDIPV